MLCVWNPEDPFECNESQVINEHMKMHNEICWLKPLIRQRLKTVKSAIRWEREREKQSVIYNIIIYTAAWTASRAQDQS